MQIQSLLKANHSTFHNRDRDDCAELLGNHLAIPCVIEMNLSSTFLATCDMWRQQVKDSQEHVPLDDTITPGA